MSARMEPLLADPQGAAEPVGRDPSTARGRFLRRPGIVSRRALAGLVVVVLLVGCSSDDDMANVNTCDPTDSSTCTLRQLADRAGILVGTAVKPEFWADDERYAEIAATEFSSLTPEGAWKWPNTEPAAGEYTWEDADAVAEFAAQHDQTVRGHTLVWANSIAALSFTVVPDYALAIDDPAVLQAAIDDLIRAVVTRYAEVTDRWDVVNEPLAFDFNSGELDPNHLTETLGEAWMVRAFQLAHELDPDASLYVNGNQTTRPGPKHDGLVALVGRLLEAGAPIHGVGLQGHGLPTNVPTYDELVAVMREWEALGLDVAITELDIAMTDEGPDAQADAYAEVFSACLDVAACVEVTMWGLSDGHTWLDDVLGEDSDPLLFDEAYNRKPAYDAVAATLAAGGEQRAQ